MMKATTMLAAIAIVSAQICLAQAPEPRMPIKPAVAIEEAGLKVFWEARLPIDGGETLQAGYLRDDTLYVTTDSGTIFSLHAETGLLRWGEIVTDAAYTIYGPAHAVSDGGRGPVIIPTTTQVYIKDRYSGKDIVKFRPAFPVASAAAGFEKVVLLGSSNQRVYALDWDPARRPEPVKRWEVGTGGAVSAAPIYYGNGNLLIASQSGRVFSCQADNKMLTWEYAVGGAILGDPFVDASGAYIASMDRSLYKFHPMSGQLLWRTRFPDSLKTGPVAVAQTVFQSTPSKGVTALDSMSGVEKWHRPEATQFLTHGTNGDVLFDGPDRLMIVDHETGSLQTTAVIPASIAAVTNPKDDSIYLLGGGGRVVCLRLDKVPYLRRQQVLMTQESLNTSPAARQAPEPEPPKKPLPPREDPFRSRRDREPAGTP